VKLLLVSNVVSGTVQIGELAEWHSK
jgi:hypothetical protein